MNVGNIWLMMDWFSLGCATDGSRITVRLRWSGTSQNKFLKLSEIFFLNLCNFVDHWIVETEAYFLSPKIFNI